MVKTNKNKKAAVEMSLNLIIMLIIGMVIMGLVISFVTSFLGNAENKFQGKLTEDDKSNLEQVKNEPGNFAFLEKTIDLKAGSDNPGKLYVKIRNSGGEDLEVTSAELGEGSNTIKVEISEGKVESSGGQDFEIYPQPITIGSGETDSIVLSVYPGASPLGTYYATFTTTINNVDYSEVITINVK